MAKVMSAMTLAEKAKDIAINYKTLYVNGCFGAPITSKNLTRYTTNTEYNRRASRTAKITAAANQSPPVFGFDCVCLIKGILWGWLGLEKATYGGSDYCSNGVPDFGASAAINHCTDVSTDFSQIEVGELLWTKSHVGIYIGDGLAVECTPSWKDGVQITAVGNIGALPGYNIRSWTKHGKLIYVEYPEVDHEDEDIISAGVKVGDIVDFTGNKHYTNSGALAIGRTCKPGKAKVTIVKDGAAHPYHLIKVSGGGSSVYGWVNEADVDSAETYIPKVGDVVMLSPDATVYGKKTKFSSWVYKSKLYVRAVNGSRITVSIYKTGAVTGSVDKIYLMEV